MATSQCSYIIEHMEDAMHEWCALEYKHMLQKIGPDHLYFTSLTDKCMNEGMPEELKSAKCHQIDVLNLPGVKHEEICLLDPAGTSELAPEDGDKFKYFLFGGILGDHPPRDRTGELRKLGFAGRRLGPVQMTTDTAVNVTKRVVEDKIPLDKIPYIDYPEIFFSRHESVTMPFRYIAETKTITTKAGEEKTIKKPLMPPGMLELLKKDNEMTLDF
ncbi:SAM-dependent RNA methyltransferase [Mucor mucedo]|uniref:SAM-dependent RNA methyltransferase n=1 Tax=Mucor mucedo TaxID=29922 RepID=UPI00221F5CEA|nr:SAM-dependent RNA methyltransferase [Mucor mucedo]KAI7889609.1 SAM-dependent RNA methyltransferase [Mucor mucedo]